MGSHKGDGSKIIIRCPTRLDSTAYQAVSEEGLQDMYANNLCKMVHRGTRRDLQYLEEKKSCLLSNWPPQSPDYNVIENMWSILKTCVFQFNITSSDALWNPALKAWNDISMDRY